MRDWVEVGPIDRFREGRGRAVEVDGVKVGVFLLRGRVHAVKDACPHMGASLADGKLVDDSVVCHWHGWKFDLLTGKTGSSSWACAEIYEVRVENGSVFLRAPIPAPREEPEEEAWVRFDPGRHLKGEDDSGTEGSADGKVRTGQADDDTDRDQH